MSRRESPALRAQVVHVLAGAGMAVAPARLLSSLCLIGWAKAIRPTPTGTLLPVTACGSPDANCDSRMLLKVIANNHGYTGCLPDSLAHCEQ